MTTQRRRRRRRRLAMVCVCVFVYAALIPTAEATRRRVAMSPDAWWRLKQHDGAWHAAATKPKPFVFSPADYGGDPSGVNDSSVAVQAAIDAAQKINLPGSFIGNGSNHGGATVDLGGGMYTIGEPLSLSGGGGGIRVCCGALRAGTSFPSDGFLLSVVKGGNGQPEDTTFENLQLDSAQRGGGIHASNALRVHVSRCYFHGFTTFGLLVDDGHEVHLTDSFLGQFYWGEGDHPDGGCHGADCTGTAVAIHGNDHWISDVVVFSGRIGIDISGAAAIVTNTHIYNGGDAALVVRSDSTRVVGCYFDFQPVIVTDPIAVDITHNFFLGAVGVEIRSSGQAGAIVSGLQIAHNQFVVGDADPSDIFGVTVNETAGVFSSVNETTIAHNIYPPATYGDSRGESMQRRATEWTLTSTATAEATEDGGSELTFDFSAVFVFDCARFPIVSARHDVLLPAGSTTCFPVTALRFASDDSGSAGCKLVVSSQTPIAGALVTVTATQGL